jgi:acetyl-CoA carboxylase biotin carboxyl carrier protein
VDKQPGVPQFLSDRLPAILDLLQKSDLSELEIREGDTLLRLRRSSDHGANMDTRSDEHATESPSLPTGHVVTAPMVGRFFRSAAADTPPLIGEGMDVTEDTVVGIIEALHVPAEVRAGMAGTVSAVLVADAEPVEYGRPLFEVQPHG